MKWNNSRYAKNALIVNELEEGQSIEEKMRIVTQTNEPIENIAPMIYTERKQGVLPECDIRTDRWEIAQEAMTAVERSITAKRDNVPTEPTNNQDKQE